MSKFLFHIRFSRQEDYLHQHELYEMLRSRNLYQVQFDLKKRLEKRIRSIELAEKVHFATSRSKKAIFLQTVQERIRKRNIFGEKYKKVSDEFKREESPKPSRVYVDVKNETDKPPEKEIKKPSEREIKRSRTAPEIGFVSDPQREPATESQGEITSIRRTVSFCGKSFSVVKSATRRSKTGPVLESVSEDSGISDPTEESYEVTEETTLDIPNIQNTPKPTENIRPQTLSDANLAVVKNMSIFEAGVTAPDGKLILSKDDYNGFIDKYRHARKTRLRRQRRKSEVLEQKVREFRIDNN